MLSQRFFQQHNTINNKTKTWLPDELVIAIMQFYNGAILPMRLVNKQFSGVVDHTYVWYFELYRHVPNRDLLTEPADDPTTAYATIGDINLKIESEASFQFKTFKQLLIDNQRSGFWKLYQWYKDNQLYLGSWLVGYYLPRGMSYFPERALFKSKACDFEVNALLEEHKPTIIFTLDDTEQLRALLAELIRLGQTKQVLTQKQQCDLIERYARSDADNDIKNEVQQFLHSGLAATSNC